MLLPAARALPEPPALSAGLSLALFSFGFWEVFWGISNIRLIACICWTRFSQEHPSSQGMFLGLLSNAPFPADVKFSPKLSPSARGGDGGKCLSLGSERSDTVLEAGGSPGAPNCHQTGAPHHLFLQHRALLGRRAALGRFQGPLTILTLHQVQSTGQQVGTRHPLVLPVPGSPHTSLFPRSGSLTAYYGW